MWHVRILTFKKFERIQHSDWGVMSRCKLLRGNQILGCFLHLPDHLLIPISLEMCELETIDLQCHKLGR